MNFKRPFLTGKDVGTYETRFGFRNEVIHQGRFPSAKEALDFARYVYETILNTRTLLKELDAEAVQKVQILHSFRGHRAVEAKAGPPVKGADGLYRGVGTSGYPMMLNTMVQGAPTDFDSRLAEAKENLWLWGFPPQK